MADNTVNVDNLNVQLPSGAPFSFVDSIKNVFDSVRDALLNADEIALTATFITLIIAFAMLVMWRAV